MRWCSNIAAAQVVTVAIPATVAAARTHTVRMIDVMVGIAIINLGIAVLLLRSQSRALTDP